MSGLQRIALFTLMLAGSPAFAQDDLPPTMAPLRTPPYWEQSSTPRYFTWTGGYIGGEIGGGWQTVGDQVFAPLYPITAAGVPGLPGYYETSGTARGVLGGGYLGYNQQFFQNLVLGLEADVEGANIHNFASAWGAGLGPYSVESYNNWRASLRGRIGYAMGHTLLYATAGAAWANFQTAHNFVFNPNPNSNFPYPPILPSDNSNTTPVGWTVGAGLEYAFMGNLAARLEYRYSDFGSVKINSQTPTLYYTDRASDHTLRVGLSYRFWAPPPVLIVPGVDAKY
jgi:outer membrane immunogenic protein